VGDKNEVYYENMETGDVVWMLPKDGDLVEQQKQKQEKQKKIKQKDDKSVN